MVAVADYYDVLHVPPEASPEVIQKSFRALVRKYHPDRNPGDRGAGATTRKLIEAYEVLSDSSRRRAYNQFRERRRAKMRDAPRQQPRQESNRNESAAARQRQAQPRTRPAANRRRAFYTEASGISLADLAQRMRAWDHLPQFIHGLLKQSVLITLVVNLVSIPVFLMLPNSQWARSPVPAGGFFIWFTPDALNGLLKLAYHVSPLLLLLNVASLVLTLLVLLLSLGFTRRVGEAVHWLAWTAAFPSAVSVASVIILAALLLGIVIVTLIMWIIIIALVIMFIAVVLIFIAAVLAGMGAAAGG